MAVFPSMRQYCGRRFVSIIRTEAFVPVRRYTPSRRVVGSTNHAEQPRHNHTSSSSSSSNLQHNNSPRHIRILGGGLAGLSMAYHLLSLQQQQQPQHPSRFDITIYDTAHEIGTGGASAVAGGYVVILCVYIYLAYMRFLCFGCQ
jgi:NAD(P)-binding Rossmann-like domain